MRNVLPAAAMLLGGLVGGCGTPQYYATRDACHNQWMAEIPPEYEQRLVNRERRIEVPDGTSTCRTEGNRTTCTQGMRTEWIPYVEAVTVDLNESRRDWQIAHCTSQRCMQTYGNADCKPGG